MSFSAVCGCSCINHSVSWGKGGLNSSLSLAVQNAFIYNTHINTYNKHIIAHIPLNTNYMSRTCIHTTLYADTQKLHTTHTNIHKHTNILTVSIPLLNLTYLAYSVFQFCVFCAISVHVSLCLYLCICMCFLCLLLGFVISRLFFPNLFYF